MWHCTNGFMYDYLERPHCRLKGLLKTMVMYQQFISLVFEIARERGRDIDSLEDSQTMLQTGATLWSSNKVFLRSLDEDETLDWLRENA